MSSIAVSPVTISITGASATQLTCASTAGLYQGQRGWAVTSTGTLNLDVIISKVVDATHCMCQTYANKNNSGGADLSAYNGGSIYFDAQVVAVSGIPSLVSIV